MQAAKIKVSDKNGRRQFESYGIWASFCDDTNKVGVSPRFPYFIILYNLWCATGFQNIKETNKLRLAYSPKKASEIKEASEEKNAPTTTYHRRLCENIPFCRETDEVP